jgi:poly(A) polymerase
MRITAAWLSDLAPAAVMAALAGFRALYVGGAVRNALLGLPPGDIDIATDATPDQVTRAVEAAGLRAVPTGVDHGTVTVVAHGTGIEVTTFRRDVETDGRHAVVAFSTDPAEDAARRDFTMNALYADAQGHVIDPLGGLPDLLARRVRFVGDPQARIAEDHLRILRFFRFHAWYGGDGIDPDGLAACAALSAGTDTLSAERVGAEMRKLLSAPDPAPSVASMAAAGVLARVLPGADPRALAPLVHLEGDTGLPPEPIRRLAALGGQGAADRLRLSRAEAKRLIMLRDVAGSMAGVAELGYRLGSEPALSALVLRATMTGAPLPPGLRHQADQGAEARFPVQAADLAPLTGPALGARLRALEAAWIASGFALTRDALLALPPPPPPG